MIPPRIPFGIGPPNVLIIPIFSSDFTTVTGVALDIRRPDGCHPDGMPAGNSFRADWPATLAILTATTAEVHYQFLGTELAPYAGIWRAAPLLTVPGGVVPYYHSEFEATVSP